MDEILQQSGGAGRALTPSEARAIDFANPEVMPVTGLADTYGIG